MKHLLSLTAAAAACLALSLSAPAQQPCPACPREAEAHTACPASTLEECPAAGCGGWDRELNCRKNLTCDPSDGMPAQYTLDDIKKLPYPQGWYSGKDRADLTGLGEGRHVTVKARLLRAEQGAPDFANCKLLDSQDRDIILLLVPDGALKKKQTRQQREVMSVTAELTPRVRRAHRKWTQDNLGRLLSYGALYVRVTGLLLLDTAGAASPAEHGRTAPALRATDWEIHPVLELEVCRTKRCADEGGWVKLDEATIPPWSARPRSSEGEADGESETGPKVVPRNFPDRRDVTVRRLGTRRARRR